MDIRPPMSAPIGAFGLPVTVTPPGEATVSTYGIWVTSLFEDPPFGKDLTRRDPRRLMAIPLNSSLADIPRGSLIVAPEKKGDASKNWNVDAVEKTEADEMRVVLVPEHI